MSKDMMPHFELYQPDSVETALDLLGRFGEDGWAMAGGHDTLDWFKDRAKYAANVVDLSGIEALHGIREAGDGIEIGAMTTLTEIANSDVIQSRYSLLSSAAGRVASPQSSATLEQQGQPTGCGMPSACTKAHGGRHSPQGSWLRRADTPTKK